MLIEEKGSKVLSIYYILLYKKVLNVLLHIFILEAHHLKLHVELSASDERILQLQVFISVTDPFWRQITS